MNSAKKTRSRVKNDRPTSIVFLPAPSFSYRYLRSELRCQWPGIAFIALNGKRVRVNH
jgi:hypothetical protein